MLFLYELKNLFKNLELGNSIYRIAFGLTVCLIEFWQTPFEKLKLKSEKDLDD